MSTEVIIPPSLLPVSPVEPVRIDDQTTVYRPAYARGRVQRQVWAPPRWGFRVRYEGLRNEERAIMAAVLGAIRGKGATLRWSPGFPVRGSFPSTELLTNNDFSNGTAGWTGSSATLSVTDRVLRAMSSNGAASEWDVYQASGTAVTQYAPYAIRSFIRGGSWSALNTIGPAFGSSSVQATDYSTTRGLRTAKHTMLAATTDNTFAAVGLGSGQNQLAGTFYELDWTSLSRCIPVDNGPNALLQSQTFQTTWTATRSSITANSVAGPDGTTTADTLNEDGTATNDHYISQGVTVASAAADFSFSCSVKAGTRDWVALYVYESTGNHALYGFFNVSTGAAGTAAVSNTNWTNARAHIVAQGNGWYRCTVTGRKASAATTLTAWVVIAEADLDTSFSGLSAASLYIWGASLAQSSVPVRYVATTTTATTGTAQTGSALYVKGLPVSTSDLLKRGDWVDINGELKRLTASLDSDAAGKGYLHFEPELAEAVADNDPIMVNSPMGRFIVTDIRETERFGQYLDVDLTLEEVHE